MLVVLYGMVRMIWVSDASNTTDDNSAHDVSENFQSARSGWVIDIAIFFVIKNLDFGLETFTMS